MSRHHQFIFPGLLCGAIMAAATVVLSQDPRDQSPRGPGGFRGGFNIQLGPPGGRAGSLLMLLGIPEVQKEVNIDDEQRKQVEKLQDEQREKMDAIFRDFQPGPPPGDEPDNGEGPRVDFRAKMEELNKQTDESIGKLLKANQLDRLHQLQLQSEGAAAFTKPEVAEKLVLTQEQKDKLREIRERGFGGFGPPQNDPKDKADALALLTADQKSKWQSLIGAEVKLPDTFGPGGNRFFGGGPMGGAPRKIVGQFDKNGDRWLNLDERKAARESLAKQPQRGRGGFPGTGGRRGPGGFGPGGSDEPGKPGPKVSPDEVQPVDEAVSLYDPKTLRTLFLEFESPDWEAELEEFHHTDVEVPATLIVDGKKYPDVGIHFRGMSSYGGVRRGSKRSMNVSLDFADAQQRLLGYKTLNLLNAHEDPTFLHTILYSHIARQYIPAPKANFVKLVINGESWGVYVNAQQFDKVFLSENFTSSKGTRWKVRGSPGGDGGLNDVGDDVEQYKRRYEIKSGDKPEAWEALIKLCRTLKETPLDQLEEALKPMLDVDQALWFLALDNALINGDGYWVRASDYCIFLDEKGKFHLIPHDMNEAFQAAMGPGMGGPGMRGPGGFGGGFRGPEGRRDGEGRGPEGRGPDRHSREGRGPDERRGPDAGPAGPGGARGPGGGFTLDPLVGLNETRKPLRSRLLAVPSLRERYLRNVRTIAQDWLDWEKLGPLVDQYETLIETEIEQDTRKLTSFVAFQQSVSNQPPAVEPGSGRGRGAGRNLKSFADQRRKYLLESADIGKP